LSDVPAPRRQLMDDVVAVLRRYGVEAGRLGHHFAGLHGLHQTDLQALILIMDSERSGTPATPGDLRRHLGLTSGAVTAALDRLEHLGHVRRERDTTDRRRVHVYYGEAARAVAGEFFGGLGRRGDAVMAGYTDDELRVVQRFLAEMTIAVVAHGRDVSGLQEHTRPGGIRPE